LKKGMQNQKSINNKESTRSSHKRHINTIYR
jgi:hypothetical protein